MLHRMLPTPLVRVYAPHVSRKICDFGSAPGAFASEGTKKEQPMDLSCEEPKQFQRTTRQRWSVIAGGAALAMLIGCGSGEGATPEALEIQKLDPPSIGARTAELDITISGTGFAPDSRVLAGDVELPVVGRYSSTWLIARVRGGTVGTALPGTLPVSVMNPGGARSNQLPLAIAEAPPPVLSEVRSNLCNGTGPVQVRLVGDNFTMDTTVESGGEPVSVNGRSRSIISFSVPRELGRYSFKVTVPPPGGGEASITYATFLECD
jgi:hypothetical protein